MGETWRSPRVLVVEDEPTIALGLQSILGDLDLTKSISHPIYRWAKSGCSRGLRSSVFWISISVATWYFLWLRNCVQSSYRSSFQPVTRAANCRQNGQRARSSASLWTPGHYRGSRCGRVCRCGAAEKPWSRLSRDLPKVVSLVPTNDRSQIRRSVTKLHAVRHPGLSSPPRHPIEEARSRDDPWPSERATRQRARGTAGPAGTTLAGRDERGMAHRPPPRKRLEGARFQGVGRLGHPNAGWRPRLAPMLFV
jgi:hypothetical protein